MSIEQSFRIKPKKEPTSEQMQEEASSGLELISDQSTEEVERGREKLVMNVLHTLSEYRQSLAPALREVRNKRAEMTAWYHRFFSNFNTLNQRWEQLRHANGQVDQWVRDINTEDDLEARYDTARKIQEEFVRLQDALHKASHFEVAEDRRGMLETHSPWENLSEVHDLFSQDVIGMEEFVRPHELGPALIEDTTFGVQKSSNATNEKLAGKIGEHGQDGGWTRKDAGIAIVFDGSTAQGSESYRIGLLVSKKVEEILGGIPASGDAQVAESYIQERFHEVQRVIEWLPEDIGGGLVFVATRVLEESGLLVSLKVGDGHIIFKNGDGSGAKAESVLAGIKTQSGGKRHTSVDGIGRSAIKGPEKDPRRLSKPMQFPNRVRVDVRPIDRSQSLQVLLTTDGLDANVLKPARGQITPESVLDNGGIDFLRQDGVVQTPRGKDDDMFVIQWTLGPAT
jgi:hypothetical protein